VRTLIVSPFYPVPIRSGGHARICNIVKNMGRGHDLHMLCFMTPDQHICIEGLEGLREKARWVALRYNYTLMARLTNALHAGEWRRVLGRIGDRLKGFPRDVVRAYHPKFSLTLKEILGTHRFDVVQIEYTAMCRYLSLIRRHAPKARVILEEIDISYIAMERLARAEGNEAGESVARDIRRMVGYERRLWSELDGIVTMSETDRAHILQHRPEARAWSVPNGVNTDFFSFGQRLEDGSKRLLFLGYFQHTPNLPALRFFLADIYPGLKQRVPEAELAVVGAAPPPDIRERHGCDGISVYGYVPDVRPFMADCQALVAPIRSGGGTRLKILESFAAGLPVVSTSLGMEGIEMENGRHALIGDTAGEFLGALHRLLTDPFLARTLAGNARKLVERLYSWEVVCRQLEEVWYNV